MSNNLIEISLRATSALGNYVQNIDSDSEESLDSISEELSNLISDLSKEDVLICFLHYFGIIKSLIELLGIDTNEKLYGSLLDPIFLQLLKIDYEQKK